MTHTKFCFFWFLIFFVVNPTLAQVELKERIRVLGEIPLELKEISGLDESIQNPSFLWAINDSGNAPVIYALSQSGRIVSSFTYPGLQNYDWEDIAVAPCFDELERSCIYIGDIGDNDRIRENFALYIFYEPNLTTHSTTLQLRAAFNFTINTPTTIIDRKFNFEAMIVSSSESAVYLFSKAEKRAIEKNVTHTFKLNLKKIPSRPVANYAGKIILEQLKDQLHPNDVLVTGGDFDEKNGQLVLGTKGHDAVIFPLAAINPNLAISSYGRIPMPVQPQPESFCFYETSSGPLLLSASEGKNSLLYAIDLNE